MFLGAAMTTKYHKKSDRSVVASKTGRCVLSYGRTDRDIRTVDILMDDAGSQKNPIEEQLKQCPEAFKAGELLERALNSLKYGQDEVSQCERWLPPAGVILPPIV